MTAIDLRDLRDEIPPAAPKFPRAPFAGAGSFFHAYFVETARAACTMDSAEVERASALLTKTYRAGRAVFSCGNGGSAAIANHLQRDHLRGVRTGTGLMPRVLSLSSNIELITRRFERYRIRRRLLLPAPIAVAPGDMHGPRGNRSRDPRRLHELRDRGGPAPGGHACHSAVHQALPDARRGHCGTTF
jgi:hypothetical protein